jgi:hypothetical protein
MRKLLFFIGTLVIAGFFAGCSKDDEKGNPLIGTWESDVVTLTFNGYSTPLNIKGRDTFTFYADKKVEYKRSDSTLEGVYTTKDNSLSITFTNLTGASFVYGQGYVFDFPISEEEILMMTATDLTFLINGNNLTLELISKAPYRGGSATYIEKTVYKKVK